MSRSESKAAEEAINLRLRRSIMEGSKGLEPTVAGKQDPDQGGAAEVVKRPAVTSMVMKQVGLPTCCVHGISISR